MHGISLFEKSITCAGGNDAQEKYHTFDNLHHDDERIFLIVVSFSSRHIVHPSFGPTVQGQFHQI